MHPNHPMVVHFPIALLLAGLFFDLVALRWRGKECRATSLSLLPLGGWTALVALLPGHLAEDAVAQGGTIPQQAIETHEKSAFAAFGVHALLVLFLGVSGSVVLLAAGYSGGEPVYRYGAGGLRR